MKKTTTTATKKGAAASSERPGASWQFASVSGAVQRFSLELPHVGDEQWFLLQTDVHWDNPHCDRALLKRHLDLALERNAPVLDGGDFFCAMQGKWDNRSNKSELRPEHQDARYLDKLVETAADWLRPYAPILTLRGQGNHETSIQKRHETNLTERLCERLRAGGAPHVVAGGFSGWVSLGVTFAQTSKTRLVIWWNHGYGGGGPVTRGVIQSNRQAVYVTNADIVWNGHTHDHWQLPIARVGLNHCHRVEHSRQVHLRTAGYKEEYRQGSGGWHVERGGPPKPVGGAWLRIWLDSRRGGLDWEITEAR